MSTPAIIVLVIAMLILWGGLALAVLRLVRHDPEGRGARDVHRDL